MTTPLTPDGQVFPYSGSSETEIQLVTSFLHISLWIWKSFEAISLPLWLRFPAEFVLFALPQTLYYAFPRADLIILITLAGLAFFTVFLKPLVDTAMGSSTEGELLGEPVKTEEKRPSFITNFRAGIMLITVTCILAVDFAAFPKRYYKTGAFGTSLMDVGIGCIIFSAGIVISSAKPSFLAAAKASAPLLVIGLVRMAMVKFAMKGGHDSEYGQYWNFFLTLGIIPYLTTAVRWIIPLPFIMPVGLLLSISYELILRNTSLQAYLCAKETGNFIGMNKVGIFGLLGCVCLYMMACGIADHCRRHSAKKPILFRKLLTFSTFTWAAYWCLKTFFGLLASRRLMNLQFILFITALSSTHLACFLLSDIIVPRPHGHAYLMEAINQNMLLVFLVANLITGAVNFLIKATHGVSLAVAISILTGYVLFLSLGAYILKYFDITIRFK